MPNHDLSIVTVYDLSDDRQPDALPCFPAIQTQSTLKDPLSVGHRNAGTIVFYRQLHAVVNNHSNNPYPSQTVFTGIVQQVPQQLHKVTLITGEVRW